MFCDKIVREIDRKKILWKDKVGRTEKFFCGNSFPSKMVLDELGKRLKIEDLLDGTILTHKAKI